MDKKGEKRWDCIAIQIKKLEKENMQSNLQKQQQTKKGEQKKGQKSSIICRKGNL